MTNTTTIRPGRSRTAGRIRRRTAALLAAPLLVAAGAGTLVATAGQSAQAATVTANGVTVAGSSSPTSVAPGSKLTLRATVRSTTARTVLVDVELHAPDGTKSVQKVWTGQRLAANQTATFSTDATLPANARTGTYSLRVGVFTDNWGSLLAWNVDAGRVTVAGRPGTPVTSPTPRPPGSGSGSGSNGTRFGLVKPGGALRSGAECAALVRAAPTPAEVKGVNRAANARAGRAVPGATGLRARVDGNFTGTTEQILRWAACKWGADEDFVKAQAAIESWWHMDAEGDWGTDRTRCAPGHALGADGKAGQCPESFGLLQVRYPYNQEAFPDAAVSSAFNADWAYSSWRSCYVGEMGWLNTVERGSQYAAGDEWGCAGVWFSGRWHNSAADGYINRVKGYLSQRIWQTESFKQP